MNDLLAHEEHLAETARQIHEQLKGYVGEVDIESTRKAVLKCISDYLRVRVNFTENLEDYIEISQDSTDPSMLQLQPRRNAPVWVWQLVCALIDD